MVRHTNKNVLIVTPLAVNYQTIQEGEKFGIEVRRSNDGKPAGKITVTNYERLDRFDPNDFVAMVCDESGAIKDFKSQTKQVVTDFMRKLPYRLLCTATASPNDYIELGTSSEALGQMGYMDMLNHFFKNDQNTSDTGRKWAAHGGNLKWRFKGHAEQKFWRWVCSWARAMRKPSDYGFDDSRFILPELIQQEYLVSPRAIRPGFLFEMPVKGLAEEREEQRRTLVERCEKMAELAQTGKPVVVWCNLNDESALLAKLLPDLVEIKGGGSSKDMERREEALIDFTNGKVRGLVIKPKIGAWGMNWQHCSHTIYTPSHSYEQFYQLVRRFWRFGQTQPVKVDIVTTESGHDIMTNLQRKAAQADRMFTALVAEMRNSLAIKPIDRDYNSISIPTWL